MDFVFFIIFAKKTALSLVSRHLSFVENTKNRVESMTTQNT